MRFGEGRSASSDAMFELDVRPVTRVAECRAKQTTFSSPVAHFPAEHSSFSCHNKGLQRTCNAGLIPVSFLWDKARHWL
jgi:hypothetical protein